MRFLLFLLCVCWSAYGAPKSQLIAFQDAWGNSMQASNESAVLEYSFAVRCYAGLKGKTVGHITKALEIDPDCLLCQVCLSILYLLSGGVTPDNPVVLGAHEKVKQLISQRGAKYTTRELMYVDSLEALLCLDFKRAAAVWENILVRCPYDLLAIRSCHDAYILLGDVTLIRDSAGRAVIQWETDPAASVPPAVKQDLSAIRSMWAFGLEESGHYQAAEEQARLVLDKDPKDVVSIHALAHVYEMTSNLEKGKELFQNYNGQWEDPSGLFTTHLAWHKALYLIQEKDYEGALQIYDTFLVKDGGKTGPLTPLGMADASALLWRLEQLNGVGVGPRWQQLFPFWVPFRSQHISTFHDMHMMMTLSAVKVNPANASDDLVQSTFDSLNEFLGRKWDPGCTPTNVEVARQVGLPVLQGLVSFRAEDYPKVIQQVEPRRYELRKVGGSIAQKDLVTLTLIEACVRNDTNLPLARTLLAERVASKDPHNTYGTKDRLVEVLGRLKDADMFCKA